MSKKEQWQEVFISPWHRDKPIYKKGEVKIYSEEYRAYMQEQIAPVMSRFAESESAQEALRIYKMLEDDPDIFGSEEPAPQMTKGVLYILLDIARARALKANQKEDAVRAGLKGTFSGAKTKAAKKAELVSRARDLREELRAAGKAEHEIVGIIASRLKVSTRAVRNYLKEVD